MSLYCESRMSECNSACGKRKPNELVLLMWITKRKWSRNLWKGIRKLQDHRTIFCKCLRNILNLALECYVVNDIFQFYLLRSTSFESEIIFLNKKQMFNSLRREKTGEEEKQGRHDINICLQTQWKTLSQLLSPLTERVLIELGRSFSKLKIKTAIKLPKS